MPRSSKSNKAQPTTPKAVAAKATAPAIAKASASQPARPPAPPIPEQEAKGKAVAAAEDSMTGGLSSAYAAEPAPAKKSNELRLKEMVQRINLEEVPENDVWLRLGQLTYAQERESSMNSLIELLITRAHPLVNKETGKYDPEYTAIMERYKVMAMLAYSRVVRISGDSSAVESDLALTSSVLRHCMIYQAEALSGGHRWVDRSIWQVLGETRIPSPYACCAKHLYGGSGHNASQKWHRTDIPIESSAIDTLPPAELNDSDVNDSTSTELLKGFLQLRPTLSFLPGSFVAEKAMSRFPTLTSLREQQARLCAARQEYSSELVDAEVHGLPEVAGHELPSNQEQPAITTGWIAYMKLKAMGEAFPKYCVNVDETLNWGYMTMMVYADGAGEEKIGTQHRWYYVPRAGSDVTDPQVTFLHGTSLRHLWSILAHGALIGDDYELEDGSPKPCGFQVMACVSRELVNDHPQTKKGLGGSGKQTRIATPFLEICGIAFRALRIKSDRQNRHATSASSCVHGFSFLFDDGYKTTSWHPWMEVSQLDPRVIKRISGVTGPEPEFGGLTIRGHDSVAQMVESARADTAMDTSQGSVAPKTPGDQRETVKKSVLERVRWFPGYDLDQEHSDPSGHYSLIEAFPNSAYVCELAPFFQKQGPMFREGNSLSLARPTKITTIASGPQAEWPRWCTQYRDAFFSVLGSSGFRAARDKRSVPWDDDRTSEVVRQGVWNHTDGIVAVSIHGLLAVTTMAAAIAHSAAPPTIGPKNPGAKQRFVVLHDGAITFRSAKNKYHDGECSKHMTSAVEYFRFGDVSVREQKCDKNAALRDMLMIAEKIKFEGSIPAWETHILIIWRGSDLHKLDDAWKKHWAHRRAGCWAHHSC